jgi:hypothetical protein
VDPDREPTQPASPLSELTDEQLNAEVLGVTCVTRARSGGARRGENLLLCPNTGVEDGFPVAALRSRDQIEPVRRQLNLAAAFARDDRHHLLGEDLHLLLGLLGREAAEFEPAEEAEIVIVEPARAGRARRIGRAARRFF